MRVEREESAQNFGHRPGKNKLNEFGLFTRNVRSLYRPGALQILLDVLDEHGLNNTGLQAIRWTRVKPWEKRKYAIYSSCH